MRLKSAIWVSAYLRRRHLDGTLALVRRRGAEEAGAVFVKINLFDGTAELHGPAPQTTYEVARPSPGRARAAQAGDEPRCGLARESVVKLGEIEHARDRLTDHRIEEQQDAQDRVRSHAEGFRGNEQRLAALIHHDALRVLRRN